MFTLVTDRSRYFRVRRGVTAEQIENEFSSPVRGGVFAGRIVKIKERPLGRYTVRVGDTYKTVALKLGSDEEELRNLNGSKPLYPTCKLFVP